LANSVAGGNWDSYGRADAITPAALDFAPLYLRPSRMRYTPQDRTLTPNYDVHDVLASVGLEDVFAVLTPGQREPDDLTPDGTSSGARVDRFYLTRDLTDAASRFARQDIGDSDHQALMLTLDGPSAARAIPPGPPASYPTLPLRITAGEARRRRRGLQALVAAVDAALNNAKAVGRHPVRHGRRAASPVTVATGPRPG